MALANLLWGKKEAKAKPAAEPAKQDDFSLYPPRARNGLDPKKMDEFAKRIAGFRRVYVAQREDQRLGSLQIYRFDRIRLRFGTRWEGVREKVLSIIESAFSRRLGADDVYVAVSEVEYYVLITSVGRQDAELRGARLAADITGKLLGTLPGGAAVGFKTMLFDFANGLDGVTTFSQLKSRIEAFGRSIDESEAALFAENAHRLRVHFKPTINLQKNLLHSYEILVRSEDESGMLLGPESLCPGSVNGVFDALLDTWTMKRAGEILQGPMAGGRSQIIVPVHYETLSSNNFRDDFLQACRRLPEHSSKQMIIHFCDFSPGVPQSRVRELAAYIRPFCSAVVASVPNHQIYTEHLENAGVKVVMMDVGTLDPESADCGDLLADLRDKASSSRLRCGISNTWSVSMSNQAMRRGIDYLNGDALLEPTKQPGKIMLVKTR